MTGETRRYEHRGRVFLLTKEEIEKVNEQVNELYRKEHGRVEKQYMDRAQYLYEKGVDDAEEKARLKYEGKLSGAALDSVVEKAKKDFQTKLKIEAGELLLKSCEDYREELLTQNFSDRLVTE